LAIKGNTFSFVSGEYSEARFVILLILPLSFLLDGGCNETLPLPPPKALLLLKAFWTMAISARLL
jgi:hypothetical protein